MKKNVSRSLKVDIDHGSLYTDKSMFLLLLKHKMLFISFSNHAGEHKFTHILKFTSSSSLFSIIKIPL